jgi:[citrate (pro-3S)-lyase] ligase
MDNTETNLSSIENFDSFLSEPSNIEIKDRLKSYLSKISEFRIDKPNIGSIVMNCNPFTLGHQHLISTAASQVDHLFIFVVEEDLSFFRFKDRIELVRKGVVDIENVTVLPGGKLIISSLTFPKYFVKDAEKDSEIDATFDLTIFAKYICPELGISKRFVGEEPFCKVTNQYNIQMKKIIEMFGITFCVIPRFESDGIAISASRVRTLLANKDYDSIKKIVPISTYNFLKKLEFMF